MRIPRRARGRASRGLAAVYETPDAAFRVFARATTEVDAEQLKRAHAATLKTHLPTLYGEWM